MRQFLLSSLLFSVCSLFLSTAVFAVTKYAEIVSWAQWTEHSDGANIAALPQFSQILRLFEEDENITVEIHYPRNNPNNNEGNLWAESLGRWLVTFGIPIRYIVLFPDSGTDDQIIITLIDRR